MKKEKALNIGLVIIIFIFALSVIILRPLSNLDEMWNYNFARNVANGLLPYKDFNIVQMPLLSFICGLFLKLITNEMIVMRILAAILCTGILYSIYKILKFLKVPTNISILFLVAIGYIGKDLWCIDYNWATLLVALNIIYIELKQLKNNNYELLTPNFNTDIILGILAGICMGFKQTTGLIISIVVLGYQLFWVHNKEELKKYFSIFKNRIKGFLIPVGILFLYLICTGSINDFVNYTILGIKHFSNYIPYIKLFDEEIITKTLAFIVPTTIAYMILRTVIIRFCIRKKIIKKEKNFNLYILLAYSLTMMIVAYPIADKIHFIIGNTIVIVLLLYFIIENLKTIIMKISKKIKDKPRKIISIIIKTIVDVIACIIIIQILKYAYYNYKDYSNERLNTKEHFQYIPSSENTEYSITEVGDYILQNEEEGIHTYILDSDAAMYMIPINKYNKDYDMFLKGNLGNKSEDDIINELKEKESIKILIKKPQFALNWQVPRKVITYIRENCKKIDEIHIFDVYGGKYGL